MLEGLGQTKRAGEQQVLLFRPQEAVAAVAALAAAYQDYYQAVGDSNRAQFRLLRAVGHPPHDAVRAAPFAACPPPPAGGP